MSVFAKEADRVEFLNLGGLHTRSSYDEVLLGPYARALADPAPKKLIVLHTIGSHWNYAHRYPARFDRWTPSLLGVDKPAHILTPSVTVRGIVNMSALATVDAQVSASEAAAKA